MGESGSTSSASKSPGKGSGSIVLGAAAIMRWDGGWGHHILVEWLVVGWWEVGLLTNQTTKIVGQTTKKLRQTITDEAENGQ